MLVQHASFPSAIGLRSITHCLHELAHNHVPPYRLMERLLPHLPIRYSCFAHDLLASCIRYNRLDRLRIWTFMYGIQWRACDSCLAAASSNPAMLSFVLDLGAACAEQSTH